MELNTSITQLNRVGKTVAKRLEYLGIKNAKDLLYYFPFRYDDFRQVVLIKDLKSDETVTVRARINLIANRRSFKTRKIITEALVDDDTGSLRVVWFNQPFLTRTLKIGDDVWLSGKVSSDMLGAQLVSPVYEKILKTESTHTARLIPVYPLTAGITEKQLRFLISQVLPLADKIVDWLPEEILESEDLVPIVGAIKGLHFPVDENHLAECVRRLKFDELFSLQLHSSLERKKRENEKAPIIKFQEKEIKNFVAGLPFVLTKTQKVSAWEILRDLEKNFPMNRMLSGDVGSGKTVVAALASYNTILNGLQAVIMAPTEILASQHFYSLKQLLVNERINIGLLTRSQAEMTKNFSTKSESFSTRKKELIEKIKTGEINLILGTHALLGEKVNFKKLGLVVVDEQHRFGVEQRKALKEKTVTTLRPHFLSMTATPIPRSFALTIYGDLDLSIINELPVGRKPIITRLVEPINRVKAYDFIRAQIKNGRQAFVVCPLIEDKNLGSEKKSVLSEYERLSKQIFSDLRVGYLHGKMLGKEKEEIMKKFKNREIDILVSTAVIEVGVDIPNASVMMIENAERFGLAQSHQFRGRVGRSIHQSYCLVFTDNTSISVIDRLSFFEKNLDGFKLAEYDLSKRGPGEVYGIEQSGQLDLKLANLSDHELIKKARDWANQVVSNKKYYDKILKHLSANNEVHWE